MLLLHGVVVVNLEQLVDHELVVGHVLVVQARDVVEDLLDLLDALGGADPEFAARALQALSLDVLDLVDGVVALLTPLELFVQEVQHREI